jgi:hypothetical protein
MSIRTNIPRLFLVALVVLAAGAAATAALASPPVTASGTFTTTATVVGGVRPAGPNTILELSGPVEYTGTLSGTSSVEGTLIVHRDGSANFHGVETFSGTINGRSGTVTFRLVGGNDAAGAVRLTAVVLSATGELAGLHGILKKDATLVVGVGPVGTYTGELEFATS